MFVGGRFTRRYDMMARAAVNAISDVAQLIARIARRNSVLEGHILWNPPKSERLHLVRRNHRTGGGGFPCVIHNPVIPCLRPGLRDFKVELPSVSYRVGHGD